MLSFQQELTNYIITKHLIKELLTDYLTKIFATIGSHFQINMKTVKVQQWGWNTSSIWLPTHFQEQYVEEREKRTRQMQTTVSAVT